MTMTTTTKSPCDPIGPHLYGFQGLFVFGLPKKRRPASARRNSRPWRFDHSEKTIL